MADPPGVEGLYTPVAEAEALLEMAVADMTALLGGGQRGREVVAVKLIRRARRLQGGDRPKVRK